MSHKTITMGERGRLVIPADTRRRLGLSSGDRLVVDERDGELHLLPVTARIARLRGAWAEPATERVLSEELIRERRAEAERE